MTQRAIEFNYSQEKETGNSEILQTQMDKEQFQVLFTFLSQFVFKEDKKNKTGIGQLYCLSCKVKTGLD